MNTTTTTTQAQCTYITDVPNDNKCTCMQTHYSCKSDNNFSYLKAPDITDQCKSNTDDHNKNSFTMERRNTKLVDNSKR